LPLGEVYDALKQHTVDARENPLPTILVLKYYEVTPIITLTVHSTNTQMILGGSEKWKALPAADKQLITSIFQEPAARASDDVDAQEHAAIDKLKTAGATVNTFDRNQPVQALQPIITSDAPWPGALYQKVRALH
jgi:TRAP-type transport system periplasmic protein